MKCKNLYLILLALIFSSVFSIPSVTLVKTKVFNSRSLSLPDSSTYVNGIIDTNTTWTAANSPFIVTDNILVEAGVTLTIEPGVQVKFDGNYYLMVKGKLNALGDPSDLITFTSNAPSPSPGDWDSIQSAGSNAFMNFNFCKIQYANHGIYSYDANLTISNSETLYNNIGIFFKSMYRDFFIGTINNNIIRSNNYGVKIFLGGGPYGKLKIENNTIIFNDYGVIITNVYSYGLNVTIARNIVSLNTQTGLKFEGSVYPSTSSINITQNYITFNDIGIHDRLSESSTLGRFFVKDNDIHDNTEYNFVSDYWTNSPYDYNASFNYWGTNNTELIDQKIYDFYDDYTLGKVEYLPILDSPLESRYPGLAIDRVKPTISITSPSNGTYIGSASVNVDWNGQDAGSGINHYEVRLDIGSWINVGDSKTHNFIEVSYGLHIIIVKALDKAGNIEVASVSFSVDTAAPSVSITSPTNGSEVRTSSVTITWSGSDEGSGIDHYEIRIDGGSWTNAIGTVHTFNGVSDGSHRVDVRAVDEVGLSKEVSVNFMVNTSLVGGPGWIDDIAVFGPVIVTLGLIGYFLKIRKKVTIAGKPKERILPLPPEAKFCPGCGGPISSNMKFCPRCGCRFAKN